MSEDPRFTADNAARFWAKVDIQGPDDCWLWTAHTVRRGYGFFSMRMGVNHRQGIHAHRWAYQQAYGSLAPDIRVDHRLHCDNRCVNPAHLRPATQKQNLENRAGAQRDSKSGVRGVYWSSRDRAWRAQVRHNQRKICVGNFTTIEAAEAAVIAKRLELFTHNEMDRQASAR